MGTYEEILSCFPMEETRPEQRQIIKGIAEALDKGLKYILVEAPTGSGKSPIAIAICKYFGRGHICTDQKSLQKQYLRDFEDCTIQAMGRANFVCKQASMEKEAGEEIMCNRGTCVLDKKFKCVGCVVAGDDPEPDDPLFAAYSASRGPLFWKKKAEESQKCNYWLHKTRALNSDIVIHNYPYLLTEGNYVGDFGVRPVLVSDECHNIEKQIMSFYMISFTEKLLEDLGGVDFPYIEDDTLGTHDQMKYGQEKLLPLWMGWLNDLYMKIPGMIAKLNAINHFILSLPKDQEKVTEEEFPFDVPKSCEGKTKSEVQETIIKLIENLENKHTTISFFIGDYSENPKNWVIQVEQEKDKVVKGEFKPVRINKFAQETYFKLGEVNILMSATILDFDNMAKDLGIPKGKYATIKIPPVFSKESNKLYHLQVCDLGYENNRLFKDYEANMNKVVETIDEILEIFPTQKGIIHCNTYKNLHFIKKHSKYRDRIKGHTSLNREEVLKQHEESEKPLVLCSPSMSEGVDLKSDTSRFQIIIKVPYPFLGDIQIKARKKQDRKFYKNRTALYLVQAIGRSVRDKEDWAYTFTIDSRFPTFCHGHQKLLENFNRHERPISEFPEITKKPKE
ncbi:MAG: helicase C-terminal domain-containing protein [Methanosarcinaceae archaeon]